MRTYQSRIPQLFSDPLNAYAFLMAKVEHKLFRDLCRGKEGTLLKSSYLIQYGITARQFNAARVKVEGKIDSIKQRQKQLIEDKKEQIATLEKKIIHLKNEKIRHQKKRRCAKLQSQLKKLQTAQEKNLISLCFGSRKLFHAQFNLKENSFASHDDWKKEWQRVRSSEIFILGSKDETAGNQSCTAVLAPDGSITLRIRMPDHLIPQFGKYQMIPLNLNNKSRHQTRALIGDAASQVIALCEETRKPLIVEALDFQKKRAQLREQSVSYARMLSSFAYSSILTHLKSRGSSKGIQVHSVNPAFTSLIGRVKFAKRYGLSIHIAAALCIGRRFLGFSEQMPQSRLDVPDGKGGHVTLVLPERNRTRHVWHQWRQLNRKLRAALTAHVRTAKSRSSSSRKTTPETENLPDFIGEIPIRESPALLFC